MFIGRSLELAQLKALQHKNTASLVCLLGRRRVGKSTLINQFGCNLKNYIKIQGLAPADSSGRKNQLAHFAEELSNYFNVKKPSFENWEQAFTWLGQKTKSGEWLILLDEISWMAQGDEAFASILKDKWDLLFSQNNKLILVTCGSVSAWIKSNILKNKNFVGRVSLSIQLKELSLSESVEFLKRTHKYLSQKETILLLSVTGGIPKYLEEINPKKTPEKNILDLCFSQNGFFYLEFDKIFSDIFGRRKATLERIVKHCLEDHPSMIQIAKKLGTTQNSDLSDYLTILEMSGFVSRDYYFHATGIASRISRIRLSDNFLRFYLKYISPNKKSIETGGKTFTSLSQIKNFEAFLGYQYENIVLGNKHLVHEKLGLSPIQIVSSAPYRQQKGSAFKHGCQIDLLINAELDILYVCEIKSQSMLDKKIIAEVSKKISTMKVPKFKAVRPVLIFEGDLYPPDQAEILEYFYKVVRLF